MTTDGGFKQPVTTDKKSSKKALAAKERAEKKLIKLGIEINMSDSERFKMISRNDFKLLLECRKYFPATDISTIEKVISTGSISTVEHLMLVNHVTRILNTKRFLDNNQGLIIEALKNKYLLSAEDIERLENADDSDWILGRYMVIMKYLANKESVLSSEQYKALYDNVEIALQLWRFILKNKESWIEFKYIQRKLNYYQQLSSDKTSEGAAIFIQNASDILAYTDKIINIFINHVVKRITHEYADLSSHSVFEVAEIINSCDTLNDTSIEPETQGMFLKLLHEHNLSIFYFDKITNIDAYLSFIIMSCERYNKVNQFRQ